MFFSATASLGAGIVLSTIGAVSINKTQFRSQIAFAVIPMIFSIQQTIEGLLWLSIPNPTYGSIQQFTTYAFVFFAHIVWPLWVPIAMLMLEYKAKQKKILKLLLGIGMLEVLYKSYCMLTYPIHARIIGHYILYESGHPDTFKYLSETCYILATIIPPFFSSIKKMWILGMLIAISSIVATMFFKEYIVSVSCFFASAISISVVVIVHQMNTSKTPSISLN